MVHSHFEQLQIYKLAEKLSDEIWSVVQQWKDFDRETVGKPVISCADLIGANIAQGDDDCDFDHRQHSLQLARRALNQTRHWLRRAYYRHLLTAEQIEDLKPTLEELSFRIDTYFAIIDNIAPKRNNSNDVNGV